MTNELYKDLLYRIEEAFNKQEQDFLVPIIVLRELNEEQRLDLLLMAIEYNKYDGFHIWVGNNGGYEKLTYYMKPIIEKYALLLDGLND